MAFINRYAHSTLHNFVGLPGQMFDQFMKQHVMCNYDQQPSVIKGPFFF